MGAARLLALVILLGACAPQAVHRPTPAACDSLQVLFVVNHGWHTGLVVNPQALGKRLPPIARDIGDGGYVEIGWGDELYYQAEKGTPGLALRALLWPTSSVLHVVPLANPPRYHFPESEVVEVWVDEAGYEAAVAFVAESFTRTPEGGVVRLGRSLYGNGWFYRAEGSFHAFNTCNTWIAQALQKTGYPISSTMTVTTGGLFSQLRRAGDGRGHCGPPR